MALRVVPTLLFNIVNVSYGSPELDLGVKYVLIPGKGQGLSSKLVMPRSGGP